MAVNKLLLFIFLFIPFLGIAQRNKSQLEKEKQENINKIEEASKILNETKSKKQATLGQLSALKQEIQARHVLISSINREIAFLSEEIRESEEIISSLEDDLFNLKEEYGRMIYAASKSRNYFDKLTFIFSSQTFNQLISRVRYFKQYSVARKFQLKEIQLVKNSVNNQKVKLNAKRQEKNNLLSSKLIETNNLNAIKTQQVIVVNELTHKENDLKKELEERKKSVKKLDKLITDLINIERARILKESKARGDKTLTPTPETIELSNSFAGNMRKLPWPVTRGDISHRFGRQAHPVLKNVYVDNLGIDILTLKNEPIRTVFKGKVVTVASVPGMNTVVMIQHGEFFTVYAKLKSVSVQTGQLVSSKDIIGEVYTDKNDVSELQFQIWHNNDKLDPESWLYRK